MNDSGLVEFHPATIVLAEAEGIWVSGLPEQARIITVGQGFVRAGESVSVVARAEDNRSSALVQQYVIPATDDNERAARIAL